VNITIFNSVKKIEVEAREMPTTKVYKLSCSQ